MHTLSSSLLTFRYETENGIKAQEQGELKDAGSDNEKLSVTGSYSYTDPDGRLISVQYIADEYGKSFHYSCFATESLNSNLQYSARDYFSLFTSAIRISRE